MNNNNTCEMVKNGLSEADSYFSLNRYFYLVDSGEKPTLSQAQEAVQFLFQLYGVKDESELLQRGGSEIVEIFNAVKTKIMSYVSAEDMKNVQFLGFECKVVISRNVKGGVEIKLFDAADNTPFATATICVPGVVLPSERHVVIKNYAENEGILDALEAAGIVKRTGVNVRSGFASCPVAELLVEPA